MNKNRNSSGRAFGGRALSVVAALVAVVGGVGSVAGAAEDEKPTAAAGDGVIGNPPATRVETVTDTYHGVSVTDDYRWLEGDNSDAKQMGKVNEEVGAWTDAQNAYTRSVLDNLPGRKELEARLQPLMEIGAVSAPSMKGNSYFYTRRDGKDAQPKVLVREGSNGTPRVLLDPQVIDPTGLTALGGMLPSEDGKLLAFSLYRAGDENTTTYVMDVATGKWFADEIPGKSGAVSWLPDNSGFFYERLEDANDAYSKQLKFHTLGQHHRQDPLIFRQYTKEQNEKLATTWGPDGTYSDDGRWMALSYWTGTSSNDLWIVDLAAWKQSGMKELKKVTVAEGKAHKFFGQFVGTGDKAVFLMQTDYAGEGKSEGSASNNRVVLIDPKNPAEANWKEIIPASKTAVLTGVGVAKNMLVADYEEKATSRIALFDMNGKSLGDLKLPGIGTAGLSVEKDRTEAYLGFASYNFPSTIFKVDLANPSADPVVWERPDAPVDPTIAEVKQVTYTSKDGTPVTMFLVHKKGLKLDGNNPTILYGYGGFNISMTPGFQPTLFPWLEDGGVYAVANLRGGGEYGSAWHEAGMRAKKQNVYDDFYAAAQYLIDNKYTNPGKLACMGGSNGGLLTGTAVTQRPDLFKAAIVAVPLLDMLRFQNFLMARYWVPEYGDATESKDQFDWIRAYSPYQNVKKGTNYPAVLVTAGENDTRVHPLHARKFGAALQAATTNKPSEKPILVWVDREAGHGQGKPLHLRLRDQADTRIFLMWQLGMLDGKKQSSVDAAVQMPAAIGAAVQMVPAMRMVSLDVKGMKCAMCAGKVEKTALKVKGVKSCEVDLTAGTATVMLEPGAATTSQELVSAFNGSEWTVSAK
jgi:prolyl oligopeptidase